MFLESLTGMTNANMKLVILGVNFDDELVLNEAKLAEGEYITKRVVELSRLYETLEGDCMHVAHAIYTYTFDFFSRL